MMGNPSSEFPSTRKRRKVLRPGLKSTTTSGTRLPITRPVKRRKNVRISPTNTADTKTGMMWPQETSCRGSNQRRRTSKLQDDFDKA